MVLGRAPTAESAVTIRVRDARPPTSPRAIAAGPRRGLAGRRRAAPGAAAPTSPSSSRPGPSWPALERGASTLAGIPYRLESSSLVYASTEVRDLLAVLRAVDDPTDEVSVVAALRSPGFGCGDDDLLASTEAGGRWDYRGRHPPSCSATRPGGGRHRRRWPSSTAALVAAT